MASLLVTALIGSACATEQPTISAPPGTTGPAHVLQPIPPTALPGNSADPTDLDASSIASDAVDVAALETLLDQAGFVGGTQRQFSRVHGGRRRILARVLTFETPQGASTYVAWLRDHGDEVIGKADPERRPAASPATGSSWCTNPTRVATTRRGSSSRCGTRAPRS